jgi:membrane associated rhomboid family serine protease
MAAGACVFRGISHLVCPRPARSRRGDARLVAHSLIPLKDNLPTDHFPVITVVIIAINVAVFLFLQGPSLSGEQVETRPVVEYGAIPYRVTNPGKQCGLVSEQDPVTGAVGDGVACEGTSKYREAREQGVPVRQIDEPPAFLTLFTSMFMHGGWLHIIFNMLFLWIFGNNIEDSMGRARFVLFYLLGGLAAVLAQILVDPDSTIPTVGASGAIAAVLGGYMLLYPRARILSIIFLFFFFTFIEIPAMIMLGIWLLLQFLPAIGQLATPEIGSEGGGVAYFAHIGGFIFGLAAIHLFAKRRSARYGQPRYPVY